MIARPIIFSAPMVRALLAGCKTQTRRLAWQKPLRPVLLPTVWQRIRPGDRLWVREIWHPGQVVADYENRFHASVRSISYRATWESGPTSFAWRSPIHMPRVASRLTLAVTATRIERLQAITAADALAEGVDRDGFAQLWNFLHGPGAWDANPWVVALTFTVESIAAEAA